VLMRRLMDH